MPNDDTAGLGSGEDARGRAGLGRFPYDPARLPFFYGWAILAGGTVGVLMSAPGQTIGVSVFTDYLIDAHRISRETLSLAYCAGTVGSALLLAKVGRLYDRFGGRWVAAGAAAALALVLVELSYSPQVSRALAALLPAHSGNMAAFIGLALGFFLLRLFGQGVLTLAARNMVMEWFEKRRGMASAVVGTSVAFGFSSTPAVLEALIQHGGWRGAWRTLAVAEAAFAALALVVYRARPEDHGLVPDGQRIAENGRAAHPETAAGRSFTVAEARRTYSFWVVALTLTLAGLLITACSFHIVSIFGDAGLSRERAVTIFIPAAFIAVGFEFSGSWLSDYIKLKYLVMVQLAGILLLSLALAVLGKGLPVKGVMLGIGMMQGMFGITATVTWPRFFGRTHLGAISGFVMSLLVTGTAVGPYAFALAHELTGSYTPAALACGAMACALLLAATRAERPWPSA